MDKDAVDRGLERLLTEEREEAESEMRGGIAGARVSAGDYSVTMGEMAGFHYSLINAVREVIAKTHLSIMVAKAIVDAYTWDRTRTIEAACEYAARRFGQPRAAGNGPQGCQEERVVAGQFAWRITGGMNVPVAVGEGHR